MRRRTVLALLGSALAAGCSGFDAPATSTDRTETSDADTETPPSRTTTDAPSDAEPLRPDRGWSLVTFETLPRTVSLARTRTRTRDGGDIAVEFARTATADRPALIRGTFTNANDYANTFELRALPLFGTVPSAWPGGRFRDDEYTYRDELLFAPTRNHEVATTVPSMSRADDGRWRLDAPVDGPWLPDRLRLTAGETVAFEYALVGRREGTGFPAARYHFTGHGDSEVVVGVWHSDRPGPTATSRFAGRSPPPLPNADRMAWYHEADAGTTVYLEPSVERVDLPVRIEFALTNHSHERLSGNPYFWRLWKLVDGDWFHVAPWGWPQPLVRVPPGGVEQWSLAAFHGRPISLAEGHSVGYLGGGRYAFEVAIARDDRTHATRFDVDAPPASLEPTDGLDVTRDGARVTVRWPRRENEVPRATLTLTRTDEATTRLLTEQLMQRRNAALRNALAFVAEDVDAVELVTDRNTVSRSVRTAGYEDGRFRFRHRGQAYEATAVFDT